MGTKIILTISVFLSLESSVAQSIFHRKTDWTLSEVKEWTENNKKYSTWHGWLLYQGSDSMNHHYISRIMDEWVWFNIKRTDLAISDERIYKRTSSSSLGYYYVDGSKDFIKIKDYK